MSGYRSDGERSPFAQEAISAINRGEAHYQQVAAFKRKAAIAAAQAILAGFTGVAGAAASNQKDENEARFAKQRELKNGQDLYAKYENTYKGVPMASAGEGPGMRGHSRESAYPMGDVPYIKEIGKSGLEDDKSNMAASGAPITWGGKNHYTDSGISDMAANANVIGADQNTAKRLIENPYGVPEGSSLSDRDDSGNIIGTGMQGSRVK